MTEEEKKTITQEKHPGRVAQGHKLVALMKKRKEEILRSKEHSTEQSKEQPTVQSTAQPTIQPTVQSSVQSAEQSNGAYVDGVRMFAVFAIDLCVFFAYNTFPKKLNNEKQDQPPKRRHML